MHPIIKHVEPTGQACLALFISKVKVTRKVVLRFTRRMFQVVSCVLKQRQHQCLIVWHVHCPFSSPVATAQYTTLVYDTDACHVTITLASPLAPYAILHVYPLPGGMGKREARRRCEQIKPM